MVVSSINLWWLRRELCIGCGSRSVPLYLIHYVRNLVSSFVVYVARDTTYFSVIAKKKNKS